MKPGMAPGRAVRCGPCASVPITILARRDAAGAGYPLVRSMNIRILTADGSAVACFDRAEPRFWQSNLDAGWQDGSPCSIFRRQKVVRIAIDNPAQRVPVALAALGNFRLP